MVSRIDRYAKAGYVLFILIFCIAWIVAQPFNAAPDEYMRYQIPQYIYSHGALPHGGDPEIRNPFWGTSYGFQPILSYIFSAGFMKVMSLYSVEKSYLAFAARMVSALCITGTVWVGFLIAKKLFKGVEQWVFVVFFSTIPEFIFLSSFVNVDALAMLSTAIIFYSWVVGLESNWNFKSCLVLAIGIALCALSYYNAYGFILCSMFLFAFSILFTCEKPWKTLLVKGGGVSAVVLLLSGWWFVRSYIIYDGDILGLNTVNKYQELYAKDKLKPSKMQTLQEKGVSIRFMLVNLHWAKKVFTSFLGVFGYLAVPIYKWIYKIYISIFAAGAAGVLTQWKKALPKKGDKERCKKILFYITLVAAMVIPVILNFIYSYTQDFQAQGRYSMPLLLPFAYFVAKGLSTLLGFVVKNARLKNILLGMFCLGCIALVMISYFCVLLPHYTKHLF